VHLSEAPNQRHLSSRFIHPVHRTTAVARRENAI